MWLEKLNILTNLSKSNRNYLLSCSYKGICTLYYLSSSLLIFLFYFLLLWWNIAQKAQKRIGGLLSFSSKILRLCDRYGSVNDHWNKSWASRGKKKKVTAKESSFMLNWLFSKSPETVVNQLREKDKIQESCTVQLSVKSVVQGFFSWYLANKISTGTHFWTDY